MTAIHDVAKAAGVSIATVSRALNGTGEVSAETRERVTRAAEKMNYRPHRAARNLRRRQEGRAELSYSIGILQGYAAALQNDPWTADVMAGIAAALRQHGYGIRLIACAWDGNVPAEIANREVDGAILLGHGPVVKTISALVPTVTIDSYDPALGAFGLVPDYRSGIRDAAARLLAAGHRRIGLTCGAMKASAPAGSLQFADQVIAGCLEAHEAAGVPPPEGLPSMVCDGSPASGYEFGKQLLADRQNRPDAVIGSDGALLGVICAAWELGLRIPQDVSLVGTDGVSMGAFFAPPLTAVDVQIARLGEIATRIVVEGASRQEFRQGVEVTPVRFVERASARLGNKV